MTGAQRRAHAVTSDLTPRESDILGLMAAGGSNSRISAALALSPKTVETHVRNIFIKLDLRPGSDVDRRVMAVLAYVGAWPDRLAA